MMDERRKVYVTVNADHRPDGTTHPNKITFDSGESYEIDKVKRVCKAFSEKVGGGGIRYTIMVCGKETYLFDEENGKWFVEAK